MEKKEAMGKCSFCFYEGTVTKINGHAQACDECLTFVWTRQHPGEVPPESFEAIKSAFAD